jgi:predicted nucleotidyltransferase
VTGVDAKPILLSVARALRQHGLEAVLIGNAAAAVQGAPVTTVDIDLFMRKTPDNVRKLKGVAKSLGTVIFRPFYPVSGLLRLSRDSDALQLDFMTRIDGVRPYNSIRSRATLVDFGGEKLWVASLADIIASKRAAGRPQDLAILYALEATLKEKEAQQGRDPSGSIERE